MVSKQSRSEVRVKKNTTDYVTVLQALQKDHV